MDFEEWGYSGGWMIWCCYCYCWSYEWMWFIGCCGDCCRFLLYHGIRVGLYLDVLVDFFDVFVIY